MTTSRELRIRKAYEQFIEMLNQECNAVYDELIFDKSEEKTMLEISIRCIVEELL